MLIVDSSVLIALVVDFDPSYLHAREKFAPQARVSEQLAAPYLLQSEFTAVIRRHVFQKFLTEEEGIQALKTLLTLEITYHHDDDLLLSAFSLASQYGMPRTYDAQYLALALRLNAELWTADQRLVNTVRRTFPLIRWLGEAS